MKQTKSRRILALLLSLVMLVSLLPLQAFSEAELTEQTETIMEQTMETDVSDEMTESDDPAADEDEQTDENPVEEGDSDYEELHEESTPTDLDESESEEPDEPAEDAATEAEQQEEPNTEPVTELDVTSDPTDEAEVIPQTSEETEIPSEETQEEITGEEADDELLIEPDDPLPQEPNDDMTEEPAEVPSEEPVDENTDQEALPETEPTEELPVDEDEEADEQMTIADCIAAYGHVYATTLDAALVYADSAMLDEQHSFTISQAGALLLATAHVPETDAVKVWFMASDGEILTGYVHADVLAEIPVTDEQADEMANILWFDYADSEAGTLLVFVVAGEKPTVQEEQPAEEPAMDDPLYADTTEKAEVPETEAHAAAIGDFLYVTTQTRVFMEVDDTAADDYYGDYFLGYFLRDAAVQVEDVLEDSFGRAWYDISYVFGPDEGDGLICELIGHVYVLADETAQTVLTWRTATDYGYPPDYMRPMLLANYYYDLEDHYGGVASFYVGESGLHATTGHDNEYLPIARHDEYGTIFATPHYMKGETAYCLEHTQNSPVVRDHDSGPYTVVDLAGYKVTPGHSGYIFSEKTMHTLAWVLRHTYPFMVLDRSDADNDVWCRVAGQFAMREVIKELEGDFYVMDYWEMDEFYRAYDHAPGVYLDYARWLAAEALDYIENFGNITVADKSVRASGGQYIGTATLYTSADQMRISKSVGTVTGNSGGDDWEYYYLYSGDTVSITSSRSKFSVPIEIIPSADDEALYYVAVTDADIQKLILPVYGDPYPYQAAVLDFEVPHGAASVTKKDAVSGSTLSGATFELLSGSAVIQTLTTGSGGTATFSNLVPGTYTIREKTAPQGYLNASPNTQTVTVTAGNTASVTFTNNRKTSKIRIQKTDQLTGQTLAGAEFTITRLSAPAGSSGVGSVAAVIKTDANGVAETGWLEWGRFRITETKVPEDYQDSGYSAEIEAYENGKTYVIDVQNQPIPGYIQLTKTDINRGTPLSGVQFDIYYNDAYGSGLAGTMTTNADGVARSGALRKGTYQVKEHANPEGYTGELVTLDAIVKPDETTYLSADNQPIQGKIRIQKSDQLTGEALAGAEFTITRISSSSAAGGAGVGETVILTTDENGAAETGWLDYGTYEVRETKVPVHFVDNSFSQQIAVFEHEKTYTLDVENEPTKGYIQIVKTDALDQTPIEGVQFDIYYNDDYGEGLAATMTTNADGVAISEPLRKGKYIVREHANPTGYVSELVELHAEVKSDETTYLSADNQPIQGQIRIVKKDELTKDALAGAEFTITRISGLPSHKGAGDGDVVAVMTTDASGVALSPLLTWGTYLVEETVVPVHFVDNDYSTEVTIETENLQTIEVEVENEPTKGFIQLTKTDRLNGNPIKGVRFDLYYNDQYGEGLATSMVTDANGVAISEPIRKGRYIVKENGATVGYFFEEVTLDATVKSDETTELEATNQPAMAKLRIYKRDADEYGGDIQNLSTRGDGELTGAEFQVLAAEDILDRQGNVVYAKGDIVVPSIFTEGEDAAALTSDLWPGKYEIVEVTPPAGYAASDEHFFVDASSAAEQSEEAVIVYDGLKTNEVLYGAKAIVKLLGDDNTDPDPERVETPEEGAEFEVYLASAGSYEDARELERDYLVTDENGYAMTKALPYGMYVLRQTVAKDGYEIKGPILFEIKGTENLTNPPILTLTNMPILYRLRFIKTDAETGRIITLANTSFKLKDADGEYVKQMVYYPREEEIDTFTTDETGCVTLPETVTWGLYFIEEVESPEGYLIRSEDFAVFVGREGDTPDTVYELDIEIPNDPVKGQLRLEKKGLQLTGFEPMTDAYGNEYQKPIFELRYLAGAVFEVRAAEDIVGRDGTVWFEKDTLVDTITTTEAGGDVSKVLPLGKYIVTEVETPAGYVCDPKEYEAELVFADNQTAIVETTVEIVNEYLPAEITLLKEKEILQTQHEGEEVRQIVATAPGEGFVFGLFTDQDIRYSSGTLMADTLVATGATDEHGSLTFSGLFPHGSYYVRELSAPDGWKLSAERYPVTLDPAMKAEDAHVIRAALSEPILNELVYSTVTLTKTDITGEETLPGAQIEVRNEDGEVIYRAYTDENGEIPDIPVTPGRYTFREIYAPEGYALNETEMQFEVDADGNITGDMTIRDDFTRVQLVKLDENDQPLEGVQFTLSSMDGDILKIEVSDENGLVTFDRIPYGTFVIEESRPLNGYILTDKKVTVIVTGEFVNPLEPLDTFKNYPNQAVIRKVDQNGKPLEGAVFGLFDEYGIREMTAVSDENGLVRFEKIPHGDYTIREIEAPLGYLLCKEVVNLTVDDSYVGSDTPIATLTNHFKRLRYKKVDTSGKALAGVEFSLINAKTNEIVETVVSDERGEFIFTEFDYGDWIIRETKVPDSYMQMEDITLHVDEGWTEPEPFTCVNVPNTYDFLKVDNRRNPIPGVLFALEDTEGNVIGEFESGEDGVVHVTGLVPGSYVIREIRPADGFTKTDEVIELTIDENYEPPKRMKRIKNYPTIQTGVDLMVTPVMMVGGGLVLISVLMLTVYVVKNRKRQK